MKFLLTNIDQSRIKLSKVKLGSTMMKMHPGQKYFFLRERELFLLTLKVHLTIKNQQFWLNKNKLI